MARNIFVVNATQVVVSESHPEGLFSVMSGFPKVFDSINYSDNNIEGALKASKVAYFDQLSKNYGYTNRAMTTVTLELANGQQVLREYVGGFPEPEPEPTPEPEELPTE